jgi:ribosome-binding protein aMBF1 (putative translation factor)
MYVTLLHMRSTAKTGFDRFFGDRMKDGEFAAAYDEARGEIDTVDELMRALDRAREDGGLSKAELARRMETQPEAVRRLLTADEPNPTLGTVIKMARSLGYSLALVRRKPAQRRRATQPAKRRSAG